MTTFKYLVTALLLATQVPVVGAEPQSATSGSPFKPNAIYTVNSDRWLEIDLYWFNKARMEESATAFWERYGPLMEHVGGWKCVILNVGWLMDSVLEWNGDLDQEISLPKNMATYAFFKDNGQLHGNTMERMDLHRERGAKADKPTVVSYDKWTYRDLKKLEETLKAVASRKYMINDLRVGCLVLGWTSIYEGNRSSFSLKHPNAYSSNPGNHFPIPELPCQTLP